jgi:TPR repeat protein
MLVRRIANLDVHHSWGAIERGDAMFSAFVDDTSCRASSARLPATTMNVERGEEIKWWNALYAHWNKANVQHGLQMARECQHPDAQWLASLFPPDVAVTADELVEVMLAQGDDPRACYLAWKYRKTAPGSLLRRAAEKGYAPAQAELFMQAEDHDEDFAQAFYWAEKSSEQGDRLGIMQLGRCYDGGIGCVVDEAKAVALFKAAAELEESNGRYWYAKLAFCEIDWERYHWWGLALAKGLEVPEYWEDIVRLLPSFEKGEHGRILHTVAPMIRKRLDGAFAKVFSDYFEPTAEWERLLELNEAILARSKAAIDCWSVVGRRCRVVKDMRVMIAKIVWEEAWRWGEPKEQQSEQNKRTKRS